jgi:hypothetical protein
MRTRRSSSFDDALSFGGRVQPVVGGLIVAVVGLSVVSALTDGSVAALTGFTPGAVLAGHVWRLVTWPVVESGPGAALNLVFGALMLYWFGRDLAGLWGGRRFLAVFFGTALVAAAATTLLALAVRPLGGVYVTGPWAILSALVVAWAMLRPDAQILLMFAVPVSGRTLLWITVGGTLLYAVFGNFWSYVPHLLAQAAIAAWMRGGVSRGLFDGLRARSLERKAKKRASHLKVVNRNGGDEPPRWMN